MKKNVPKVRYDSRGQFTVAATSSIALLYWYMRVIPQKPLPDPLPEAPVVIRASQPIPGPYHKLFLPTVTAGVERTMGSAPDIPDEMLDSQWYETLPDNVGNHNNTLQALKDSHPQVMMYEAVCWNILKFLEAHGEIQRLERK